MAKTAARPSRRRQVAKLFRVGRRLVTSDQYRAKVLDIISRQTATSEVAELGDLAIEGTATWLQGKRLYLVGGCELTFIKEFFEARGVTTYHTFDHGRPVDPYTEISDPDSPVWAFDPSFVVVSQVQQVSGPINRLQWRGIEYQRDEQERDLRQLADGMGHFVSELRERGLTCPAFLLTHPILYRPAFGILEHQTLSDTMTLAELVRTFELYVYDTAKSLPNTHVLDVNLILEQVGKRNHLKQDELLGQHFTRAGGALVARDLLAKMHAVSPGTKKIKCAAFDLDDTLWGGVLREDGVGGVRVRSPYLNAIKYLAARGILIAICSKNDPAEADHLETLLGGHLHGELAAVILNWSPKSANLRQLADTLNIGLDSIAFFDDNPRERAEVAMNAPEVLVLADVDILRALNLPEFQPSGPITHEARLRSASYRAEARRRHAALEAPAESPNAFLATLDLEVVLGPAEQDEIVRVGELIERTNQLNATLRRTTAADLTRLVQAGAVRVHVAHLVDRFGDYGLVGAAVCSIGADRWELQEFAFSCRAMGKGAEAALLAHLRDAVAADGKASLLVPFRPTDRNHQLRRILDDVGFAEATETMADPKVVPLVLDAHDGRAMVPPWLSVTVRS